MLQKTLTTLNLGKELDSKGFHSPHISEPERILLGKKNLFMLFHVTKSSKAHRKHSSCRNLMTLLWNCMNKVAPWKSDYQFTDHRNCYTCKPGNFSQKQAPPAPRRCSHVQATNTCGFKTQDLLSHIHMLTMFNMSFPPWYHITVIFFQYCCKKKIWTYNWKSVLVIA